MLAVVALICFVVALFVRALGPIDLVILGLVFVAAHLAFGVGIPLDRFRRPRS